MQLLDDIEEWIFSGAWILLSSEDRAMYRLEVQDLVRDPHGDFFVRKRAARILYEHDIRYAFRQRECFLEEKGEREELYVCCG